MASWSGPLRCEMREPRPELAQAPCGHIPPEPPRGDQSLRDVYLIRLFSIRGWRWGIQ